LLSSVLLAYVTTSVASNSRLCRRGRGSWTPCRNRATASSPKEGSRGNKQWDASTVQHLQTNKTAEKVIHSPSSLPTTSITHEAKNLFC